MAFNPLSITRDAIRAVPVVRYALALAAISLFASIIRGSIPDVSIVSMFPFMIGIMLLMLFLVVVAKAADLRNRLSLPALFMVWAVTLCTTVLLAASVSAILFGAPASLARIILPKAAADNPIIDPGEPTASKSTVKTTNITTPSDNKADLDNLDQATTAAAQPVVRSNGDNSESLDAGKRNQTRGMTVTPPQSTAPTDTTPITKKTPVSRSNPSGFYGTSVFYYPKGNDAARLLEPLRRNSIPYSIKPAQLTDPKLVTNAIACSPDVPIQALQRVIRAFREAGLPIRQILQFRSTGKTKRIEILSLAYGNMDGTLSVPTNPPLTVVQTDELTGCPEELINE